MFDCRQILEDNPLTDFVELPEGCDDLVYCNILCGVIRGALEMVNMNVTCNFVRDVLTGDEVSELRVRLVSLAAETYPFNEDD